MTNLKVLIVKFGYPEIESRSIEFINKLFSQFVHDASALQLDYEKQSLINLQNEICLAVGKLKGVRLFRNNVQLFKTQDGRNVQTGLCVGSSDLIGFQSITITPEMIGQKIAVFTAIEVKTEKGKVSRPNKINSLKWWRSLGKLVRWFVVSMTQWMF